MTNTKATLQVKDKKSFKHSEATKKLLSDKQKLRWKQRRKENQAEQMIKKVKTMSEGVPRIGDFWQWDIKYKRVGFRRLITPVPIREFLPDKKYNVPAKFYFGDVLGSTLVKVQHFYTYSLRAQAAVPVFEAIYSPWMIKNKIKPEQLLNLRNIEGENKLDTFIQAQEVVAGHEVQKLLGELQVEKMMHAFYKEQFENLDTNVVAAADKLAAEMTKKVLKGKRPPSETRKLFSKVWGFLVDYKGFFILLFIFGLLLALILYAPLPAPTVPTGVTP